MSLSNWMSGINDNRKLCDIIMPGSHDAGMSKHHMPSHAPTSIYYKTGRTQSLDVQGQCDAGSRFFDIRLTDIHGISYAQHEASKALGIRAIGEEASHILIGVKNFLNASPSEIVLIRISKSSPGSLKHLEDDLEYYLGSKLFKRDSACNLLDLPIGLMRGCAIVLIDRKQGGAERINQKKGLHQFLNVTKNKVDRKIVNGTKAFESVEGVVTCGCYSNKDNFSGMLGDLGNYASGIKRIDKAGHVPEGSGQVEHWGGHVEGKCGAERVPHLFMLYWTYTNTTLHNDVSIRAEAEGQVFNKEGLDLGHARDMMSGNKTFYNLNAHSGGILSYFGELSLQDKHYWTKRATVLRRHFNTLTAKNLCMPNIVMYDFISPELSQQIVDLNHKDILNEVTRMQDFQGPVSQPIYENVAIQGPPGEEPIYETPMMEINGYLIPSG